MENLSIEELLKTTKEAYALAENNLFLFNLLHNDLKEIDKICYEALNCNNINDMKIKIDKLKNTSSLISTSYPYLVSAIDETFIKYLTMLFPKEKDLREKFIDNIDKYLPKAKIIQRKNLKQHIPDLWVSIDGEEIPIEMKLKVFTNSSLAQLERYMNVYKCNKGIAVAQELSCYLPNNIKFIQFSFDK